MPRRSKPDLPASEMRPEASTTFDGDVLMGDQKTTPIQPGALIRIASGVVGEWTGRVAFIEGEIALEIENEGAKGWWSASFLRSAYERGAP